LLKVFIVPERFEVGVGGDDGLKPRIKMNGLFQAFDGKIRVALGGMTVGFVIVCATELWIQLGYVK
jgi:hypothetical protein